jgi:hypothetical protein
MRRVFVVIFTLFYSLVSSGAPALLHYCNHEKKVHVSLKHESHHEQESCCNASKTNCNAIGFKSTNTLDADDCCLNIQTELNESNFEELSLNFILPQLSFQRFNTKNYLQLCAVHSTNGPIQNNGPPLFLKFHQIIIYD